MSRFLQQLSTNFLKTHPVFHRAFMVTVQLLFQEEGFWVQGRPGVRGLIHGQETFSIVHNLVRDMYLISVEDALPTMLICLVLCWEIEMAISKNKSAWEINRCKDCIQQSALLWLAYLYCWTDSQKSVEHRVKTHCQGVDHILQCDHRWVWQRPRPRISLQLSLPHLWQFCTPVG